MIAMQGCQAIINFPGNIRELENIIEHAYILCRGDEIQEGCLPQYLQENLLPACYETPAASRAGGRLPQNEKETIIKVLRDVGGHCGRADKALGIDKSTLWRKMKKYGNDFAEE